MLIAAVILWTGPQETQVTFNGLFLNDDFSVAIKSVVLLMGVAVLALTKYSQSTEGIQTPEYPILILLAILGMMLMVSANDLLAMFMGIELQSLSLYILIAMRKNNSGSSEAALKYFILGALSTGIFLYGCSLIYGFTGTTHFENLEKFFKSVLQFNAHFMGPCLGMILILSSLAFKISAAPFHMWTPDVYQGAQTSVTTFLATVPKIAAFAVLMRVLASPLSGLFPFWSIIIVALSVISMFWGAIAALTQQNIKRLIAYSSIGHTGFALVGVTLANESGLKASLIYLVFYVLMTLGFFGGLLYVEQKGREIQTLSHLSGLGKDHPMIAFLLGFILFSMAGIPPLPGFIPKLLVLRVAISHASYALAVLAILYSVIAAAYYLLIIKAMFIDKSSHTPGAMMLGTRKVYAPMAFILTGVVLLLVWFMISPDLILQWASKATIALVYQ